MLSDHSSDVCYNEDGTEVLAVVVLVVVALMVVVLVVVALNGGRKVGHQVVVVVVGSPSCEALVVLDKNDEVVLADSACNHRHNAGRNHLQRTLFLVCLL